MTHVHDETAPGDLELVQAFINTRDLLPLPAKERLATPELLRAWLTERGLLGGDAAVDAAAWEYALGVREALRTLLASKADPVAAAAAVAQLEAVTARAPLCVRFVGMDTRLEPTDRGVAGAMSRLLAIVHDSMREGTWERMKACGDPACAWAFYDHSKNRSGVWCDMASCGNRNKARRRRASA